MPRVIKEKLHKSIISDYRTLLNHTTVKAARDTIQERIEKLELAPKWRQGQNYAD